MKTIAQLRTDLNNELDVQANTLGETTVLSQSEADAVSYAADAVNETWNEDLPPRPPKS